MVIILQCIQCIMKSVKLFISKWPFLLLFTFFLIATDITIAERLVIVQIDINQIDSPHSYHIIIVVLHGLRVFQTFQLIASDSVQVLKVVNVDIYKGINHQYGRS